MSLLPHCVLLYYCRRAAAIQPWAKGAACECWKLFECSVSVVCEVDTVLYSTACGVHCAPLRAVLYCMRCALLRAVLYCMLCALLRAVLYCMRCAQLSAVLYCMRCELLRAVLYCMRCELLRSVFSLSLIKVSN